MPTTVEPTYYELLGVAPTSSDEEVRSAYRRLARVGHPDAGGNAAIFGLVQAAYECLSDPARRAGYDSSLRWQGRYPGETAGPRPADTSEPATSEPADTSDTATGETAETAVASEPAPAKLRWREWPLVVVALSGAPAVVVGAALAALAHAASVGKVLLVAWLLVILGAVVAHHGSRARRRRDAIAGAMTRWLRVPARVGRGVGEILAGGWAISPVLAAALVGGGRSHDAAIAAPCAIVVGGSLLITFVRLAAADERRGVKRPSSVGS